MTKSIVAITDDVPRAAIFFALGAVLAFEFSMTAFAQSNVSLFGVVDEGLAANTNAGGSANTHRQAEMRV